MLFFNVIPPFMHTFIVLINNKQHIEQELHLFNSASSLIAFKFPNSSSQTSVIKYFN